MSTRTRRLGLALAALVAAFGFAVAGSTTGTSHHAATFHAAATATDTTYHDI
jgi:hypothetical protein